MKKCAPFYLILPFVLLLSCDSKKSAQEDYMSELDSTEKVSERTLDMTMQQIMRSIPSPLEISFLVKESSSGYERTILHDPSKAGNYNTATKQAMNIGIYGTDLGYANLYNQKQGAISYLNAIRSLADELQIGQFFDFNTIRELTSTDNNLDSILRTTSTNFERINSHLSSQNREVLSLMMITGGWVEAVNLACQVNSMEQDKTLESRIAEQKIVFDQLLLLLKSADEGSELHRAFQDLQPVYDKVNITYSYAKPTMKEVNGVLEVEQNSDSQVTYDDTIIREITEGIAQIRDLMTR